MQNVGGLEKSQDIKGYDKLSFQTGNIQFSNVSGELDFLDSEIVTGNDVRVYYLDDSLGETQYRASDLGADKRRIRRGLFPVLWKRATIRVMDKRKAGNLKIPVGHLQRFWQTHSQYSTATRTQLRRTAQTPTTFRIRPCSAFAKRRRFLARCRFRLQASGSPKPRRPQVCQPALLPYR